MFSLKNAYHGLVGSSSNLTNLGTWNAKFRPGIEFEKLAWPSEYRGSNNTMEAFVKDVTETLDSASVGGKVAGAFFECIQGVGGINPVPLGYLPKVVDLIRNKYGGLIVCD